jgi:hypothetical protein
VEIIEQQRHRGFAGDPSEESEHGLEKPAYSRAE